MTASTATVSWYKQRKVWLRLLQLTPFFWIIVWFLFNVVVLFPLYGRELVNLETEFNRVAPPTQSQLLEYTSNATGDRATIVAKYGAELDYKAMREYYDGAFARNRWTYSSEDDNKTVYCKGNYTASLYRSKTYPGSGYELWYRIGITSDCELSKGGGIIQVPLYDVVFLLGCSITFLIPYALVMGWASLIMKQKDYLQLRSELISKPQSIWHARLWAIISLLVGLLALLMSTYKIAMYLVNW